MKKLVFIFIMLISLCSCKDTQIEPKLTQISFTAELSYFNEVYSFDGQILKDKTLKITMKEPEGLKDLNLTVNSDGITAEYMGLTYIANEATMPFSRIIAETYTPLVALAGEESVTADKNGEISGKADEIEYKLTVSPTGLPQKLELDSRHITVKFYNISIKEE